MITVVIQNIPENILNVNTFVPAFFEVISSSSMNINFKVILQYCENLLLLIFY